MEAGSELDMLVAEKVMGYVWRRINSLRSILTLPDSHEPVVVKEGKQFTLIGYQKKHLPAYSTDIAAAWTVAERLRNDFTRVEIHLVENVACVLLAVGDELSENYPVTTEAVTAPIAICLAALKAVATKERDV